MVIPWATDGSGRLEGTTTDGGSRSGTVWVRSWNEMVEDPVELESLCRWARSMGNLWCFVVLAAILK